MHMTGEEWAAAYAAELGMDSLTPDQVTAILKVASVAAHSSERLAAPLAVYLGGVSGKPVEELLAAAQRLGS